MRVSSTFLAAALLVLGACTDVITSPTVQVSPPSAPRAVSDCDPMTAIIPCPEPEVLFVWPAWAFFGTQGDVLYEAPGDPSPGAPGIWLGANVWPGTCFNNYRSDITDADYDWLDDGCELELARGFAPRWSMGIQDHCPDGEPVWAAKVFPNVGIVRLAFMPAYYDDCGAGDPLLGIGAGHEGDSELVTVDVSYNVATRHWEFRSMWLSAHSGEVPGDRSQLVGPNDAAFTRRHLAHPYVAVSADKHANYKNDSKCNNTVAGEWGWGEACYGSMYTPFRFPIDPARNAGSRHRDLMGCVGSIKRFAGNGRTECFFTYKPFAGWHTGENGQTPYYERLSMNPSKFEQGYGSWGPGPAAYVPPPDQPPPVVIGGCPDPTQIICTEE